MPFDLVTWHFWEASLGSFGACDMASLGSFEVVLGGIGGSDMALFRLFLMVLGASDVASVRSIIGSVWGW